MVYISSHQNFFFLRFIYLKLKGVLIYTDVVLTAAHCIEDKTMYDLAVVVGLNDITIPVNEHNSPYLFIASYSKYHENYRQTTYSIVNDIALIKLKKHVTLSSTVGLLCLPPEYNLVDDVTNVVIAGWGSITGERGFLKIYAIRS